MLLSNTVRARQINTYGTFDKLFEKYCKIMDDSEVQWEAINCILKGNKGFTIILYHSLVGGGTSGSVMAYRLSQNPCVNVLLLEAGGEGFFLTDVPSLARIFYKTDIDWQYKTTPQKYSAFGQINNVCIICFKILIYYML